jgi:hypothetical protein
LYQTTFDAQWFVAAQELAEIMLTHFQASEGGFFDTSDDHETLITRPRDLQDNATPSGNAMAVTALLKLAGLTNEVRTIDIAHEGVGADARHDSPVSVGLWPVAPSAGVYPFKAAGDCHRR